IEDILEFGNVQRAILGIQIANLNVQQAEQLGIKNRQGVYVADVEKGSGAEKGGIRTGDVITKLDQNSIRKYSDLAGYLSSKRPNETVMVTLDRNGKVLTVPVTLIKLETYEIESLGLEVKNTNEKELRDLGAKNGVKITRSLSQEMAQYNLTGIIIKGNNKQKVDNIDDVKNIIENRQAGATVKIDVIDQNGNPNTYFFR